MPAASALSQLCLACGLCCNGVLFRDVELQSTDDPALLRRLGLALTGKREPRKLPQPCAALDGCHCRVYADRPARCRQFDCALLSAVRERTLNSAQARQIIAETQRRAGQVLRLLRELQDRDETRPLSLRFQRTQRRFERGPVDEPAGATFGELTLAVHDLNLLLRSAFHPD